jgi:amino acid adenylation domain-containing protein
MSDLDARLAALPPDKRVLLARLLRERGTVVRAEIEQAPGSRRVSDAQRQFWLLWQQDGTHGLYNVPMALRLRGAMNPLDIEWALREVVRRHEILRTRYLSADGEPVPDVLPADRFTLERADLAGLPEGERESAAREVVGEYAQNGFDIGAELPIRALLVRLGPDDHVLAVIIHHIATDGASSAVFFRDFTAAYEARRAGADGHLPELPIQYRDFASWQQDRAEAGIHEKALDFWESWLRGVDTSLDLPTDHVRPPRSAHSGRRVRRHLGSALAERIHALSDRASVTPFMTLLTALGIVIRRYTGKEEFLIGTSVSHRPTPHTEQLIGCFANTAVLRVRLDGTLRVREALARVREDVTASYEHQEVPFEKVVARIQPERTAARSPLFQVMFVYQQADAHDVLLRPAVDRLDVHNGTAKFDLDLSLLSDADGIDVSCEYDAEIFDAVRIERMLGHLEVTLRAMTADPDAPLGALPSLTAAEQETAARRWNDTGADFPADRTLIDLFLAQVSAHPGRIAVAAPAEQLTYQALDRRSNQLCRMLSAHGVRAGDVVGVAVERAADLPVALLAILKCGAAYLPLDPAYPAERVSFILRDTRARLVVTTAGVSPQVAVGDVPLLVLEEAAAEIDACADAPIARVGHPDDLCYVIYTSGSTGRPKGVRLDQRGRVNNFTDFNRRFGIGPDDAVLSVSSLSFDMTAYDVLGTLIAGAILVLPEPARERDPGHWLELVRARRVTIWHSVPTLLGLLLDAAADLRVQELPALRVVLLGGDWIPLSMPDRVRRVAPGATVVSLGGATEASMDSTIFEIGDVCPDWRSVPYGQPMANQLAYILDLDGQLVPPGVPGELFLGGIGLAWGYANAPGITAARFVPDPFSGVAGARMYQTGDLARYGEDGIIELIGRADFQVKIAGNRVELGEIEAVLRERPEISAAVVAAPQLGGRRVVVGYVVPNPGEVLDTAEIRAALQARLPAYMVPAQFVQLPAIPLTPNGKVDRGRLPAPDADTKSGRPSREPQTATEIKLAAIWGDLLVLEVVPADESFFALGGDSVICIRMVTRARAAGLELTPKLVFEHQTIAELAVAVGQAQTGAGADDAAAGGVAIAGEISGEEDADRYPLAPIQRHMLAIASRRNTPGLYVIRSAFPLSVDVDDRLFDEAVQVLAARHAVLRTSYHGTEPAEQFVAERVVIPVEVRDLRELDADEQERWIDAELAEIQARGFDLGTPPLIRFTRYRLTDALQLVVQHHHYSILDGWSCMQLRRELLTAYLALAAGETPVFDPPRPFAAHVAWLARQDRTTAAKFWRSYLDGYTGQWAGEPVPRRERIDRYHYPLVADTLAATDDVTRAYGITFATMVQLAWAIVLAGRTGTRDVVFGVTSSGRPTLAGVDTAVGPFINIAPVRMRFRSDETVAAAAQRLQGERIDAEEHAILDLSEATGGRPLGSLLVFDNYPVAKALEVAVPGPEVTHPLLARDFGLAQTEVPVRVDVLRGAADALALTFAPDHELPADAAQFGQRLLSVLHAIATHPDETVGDTSDSGKSVRSL